MMTPRQRDLLAGLADYCVCAAYDNGYLGNDHDDIGLWFKDCSDLLYDLAEKPRHDYESDPDFNGGDK